MADADDISRDEDDELAAVRWVLAIDDGLGRHQVNEFHAWLAARPERAEVIARQVALQTLAAQLAEWPAEKPVARAPQLRRRALLAGAIAATVAAAAFVALAPPAGAPWKARPLALATAKGEVRAADLADASRLWLDAHTLASVTITSARREIELSSGRIFVEVAADPQRPFVVRGAQFEARALGTAFEAMAFEDRAGIAVAEGTVRLTTVPAGQELDVAAGEAAWIEPSGEVTRGLGPVQAAAWREGRMVLTDRRLDAALDELSRYFDRPLIVTDTQLAARRVSLSFSIADMDAVDAAAIIARAVGADVLDLAGRGVVLSPAGNNPAQPPP